MFRSAYFLLFSVFLQLGFSSIVFGQRMMDVTIRLDNTIDLDSLLLHYDDGLVFHFVESGLENRELRIQKNIYAPYAMFDFAYGDHSMLAFFVNEEPTLITLGKGLQANGQRKLHYSISNGTNNIWDTTSNSILSRVRRETKEELNQIGRIYQQHGHQLRSDDSVRHVMQQQRKELAFSTMAVLKDYPDDYFAFYYFKSQIVTPDMNSFFRNTSDSLYFSSLLSNVKNNFSSTSTDNEGGKRLLEELASKISPPPIQGAAPHFSVRGQDGELISLKDLRGKYVLLDFWATWCPPCMAAMPSLKKLRQDIPEDRLKIIGISSDRDSLAYANVIRDKQLNWSHYLDSKRYLGHLFNIEALPTMVLLDPEGNMVYRKVGTGSFDKLYDLIRKE